MAMLEGECFAQTNDIGIKKVVTNILLQDKPTGILLRHRQPSDDLQGARNSPKMALDL